jgi:hypothetical protein
MIRSTLLVQRERLSRTGTAYRKRTWTGMESVRVMCTRFFPARCTSIQIIVTLGYE